jgi:hypothetical protein
VDVVVGGGKRGYVIQIPRKTALYSLEHNHLTGRFLWKKLRVVEQSIVKSAPENGLPQNSKLFFAKPGGERAQLTSFLRAVRAGMTIYIAFVCHNVIEDDGTEVHCEDLIEEWGCGCHSAMWPRLCVFCLLQNINDNHTFKSSFIYTSWCMVKPQSQNPWQPSGSTSSLLSFLGVPLLQHDLHPPLWRHR